MGFITTIKLCSLQLLLTHLKFVDNDEIPFIAAFRLLILRGLKHKKKYATDEF